MNKKDRPAISPASMDSTVERARDPLRDLMMTPLDLS